MSADQTPYRRLRVILDCILVILVIVMASASYLSTQARSGAQPSAREAQVSVAMPLTYEELASAQPAAPFPVLDDNTLAAMIAAENAALTNPNHFIDLPLIVR